MAADGHMLVTDAGLSAQLEQLSASLATKEELSAKSYVRSPNGSTTLSADDANTASISYSMPVPGQAKVILPDGFSIEANG